MGTIESPNKKIKLNVKINEAGAPNFDVKLNEVVFLENSSLGMKTSIGQFAQNLKFIENQKKEVSETYELNRAKVSKVDYRANELVSTFINENSDTLKVIFRVSDRDLAFSYKIIGGKNQTKIRIKEETTAFNLPDYATAYITSQALPMIGWENTKPSYEEEYLKDMPVGTASKYGVGFTFPALFKLGKNGWVLISETGVHGQYVGSRLGEGNAQGIYTLEFPQEGENNGIGETYPSMALPAQTPWRTLTLGESLKPIVESTVAFDLVKPLYKASQEYKTGRAAWSWIVWQDKSINYDDQVRYIDMAADLDFEYVLIDNWWDNNIGHQRMEDLVQYANSKNVDVILWYNSNGYWNNAPQTPQDRMNSSPSRNKEMKWMQKIGVKGIKVDFFGGDKQHTMRLYEDILTDANNYGLGVTFHGCTLPRGWQRMFPNFITSEAVLASENLVFRQEALDKHALNATILPFTRNAVGTMDFAPVFLNNRLSRKQNEGTIRSTTDAFELATSVLYFSPVQHFGLTPNNLDEQPEYVLDFLREVPTTWDETVFIEGVPGKHCVIARRKGSKWYVAAVNGEKIGKELNLDLPMLKNEKVQMIYDKEDLTAGEKKVQVSSNAKLKIKLLPEGGALLISN
ncbi:glycoside hydrolase family 97 protein [Salegentibacter sp. 24]|uniref:glycoside hydrolase family 97 protein n=1 Tax=Salegentibacter sp. 24 TaxID=2183986 RepID=UPI001FB80323|nr:glycoside hydrolase family 97 protein [Salegentibacter sp. 24]